MGRQEEPRISLWLQLCIFTFSFSQSAGQRYEAAGHFFAKRRIAHDFFRCTGAEPLPLDASALRRYLLDAARTTEERRSAFMICHLTPTLNAALAQYQRDVCHAADGT